MTGLLYLFPMTLFQKLIVVLLSVLVLVGVVIIVLLVTAPNRHVEREYLMPNCVPEQSF